ncbi:hypothetical protein [Dactylosporangium sp. NPDC051541]|uniref:hypothetical protein n=1 Tax=Dactylosporangium sp. NPDC051541 TaxID=3363977 RepID=UPI0037AD2269
MAAEQGDGVDVVSGGPSSAPLPRRTRLLVLAAVAVVVAGAVVAFARCSAGGTPQAASTSAGPTGGPASDGSAATGAAGSPSTSAAGPPLPSRPQEVTELPARLTVDPAAAAPLSARPVTRARALVQPRADEPDANPPVLALAEDNTWRRLDVGDLRPAVDAAGNPQPVLDVTSLSPDGRRAAFAQPDKVVIVDLTTGRARTVAVPGFNENAAWSGEQVLVTQSGRTYLAGGPSPAAAPYAGDDVLLPAGATVSTLSIGPDHQARLGRWPGGDQTPVRGATDLMSWSGPGWRSGDLAARVASVSSGPVAAPTGPPTTRLVLVNTAAATASFADLPVADIRVLGWRDPSTVLLDAGGRQVLAYHTSGGSLTTVSTVTGPPALLSLADGGR